MHPIRAASLATATIVLAVACFKVPYTGRKPYNLVPETLMISLGKTTYQSTLSKEKVQKKGEDAKTLNRVGEKVAKVAKKDDYAWEYSLIESDEPNAWALPGGYIGFYTALLPTLQHEAGMAFVMGHEVAHAVARHGGERLTQQLTLFGGLAGLYAVLDTQTELDAKQSAAIVAALGIATEVGVLLPFSRMHESEADVIGVMYMGDAGYPPDESLGVWDRMAELGGAKMPVFLSTHPSHDKRQANIREWLPRANKRYQRNRIGRDTAKKLW